MKEKYTLKEDGFQAVWFEGSTYHDKVIIYMSGAKCGEQVTINCSKDLRDAGYSVLCLGFYLWKGMPKEMYHIPVEYVERAVKELKANGFSKIALHGMSTGAGYALLCASLISEISCTIATVPYDYIMAGMKYDLIPLSTGVYSHHGKSLPYSQYACLNQGYFHTLKSFLQCKKQKGFKMVHIMRYAYDTSDENEASRIKVENMKSDLLLMAPTQDDCWPSEQAVPRIERILKENNYPYRVKAIMYENASHMLGVDANCFFSNAFLRVLAKGSIPAEKKHPKACEAARKDSRQQILSFLKDW